VMRAEIATSVLPITMSLVHTVSRTGGRYAGQLL
jgi:hypothetical protein